MNKIKTRYRAYSWLSKEMGKNRGYTHIGMFDFEDCNRVIDLSKALLLEVDTEKFSPIIEEVLR